MALDFIVKQLILLIACTSILPATCDLTSPHNPTLIQPEQLGVAYYNILGVLHGPQNMAGALHVFVKAVHTADNGHQLRGFVYYDDCQDLLLWANLKLSTPAMLTTWVPTITITSNAPGNHRAVFTVNSAISDGRPFTFEGHLPPLEQPEYSYLLHVDTWPRHVALTRALHDAHPPPDANTPSQVFTVVGQLYRLPTALAARLTLLHVDYHTRMGFAGTLLYVHNTMADSMGTHPALQQLVAQGRLGLVQWRYMAQYVEMGTYDQVVVHNHALLALWARNAWAFITDLDELLATPHPTNVHALLGPGGCMSGHQTITLPQYDTLCQSCVGVDQRSTEFDHGVDHDVLHGEAGMWLGNATGLKPLKEYTLRNTSPLQTKMIVQPDYVHQFFVHDTLLWISDPPHRELVLHDQACAYVAHLRNLVYPRVENVSGYEVASDWLWVLPEGDNKAL